MWSRSVRSCWPTSRPPLRACMPTSRTRPSAKSTTCSAPGLLDQPFDVFGDQLLGADPHVHGQRAVGEQASWRGVFRGADARDLGRRAVQRVRDLAGDHVHFVGAGQRHQHVGVGDAGGLEHGRIRGVAGDGAHVDAALQVAQHVLVGIHDRDFVVRLARQVLGRSAADLTGAEDQHFHRTISRFANESMSHLAPCCSKFTCTRACAPWPSRFRMTPSPNLPWRTRAPSLMPGATGSAAGSRNRATPPAARAAPPRPPRHAGCAAAPPRPVLGQSRR